MDFEYHYLGFLNGGEVISVKINQQAHVALLDTPNLSRYARRQRYRHYGGLQSYAERRYKIPFPGEWHIAINTGAPSSQVRGEVRFR